MRGLFFSSFGNPSSIHQEGRRAKSVLLTSQKLVSEFIKCQEDEIYWTSGATESNSWVFHSAYFNAVRLNQKPRFIISAQEHESILAAAHFYERQGAEVLLVPTQKNGSLDLNQLDLFLDTHTKENPIHLVSIQLANNETGVLHPIQSIAQKVQSRFGILFHVDAVQGLSKIPLDVKKLGAHYYSFSAHKLGASKGLGWLIENRSAKRSNHALQPLLPMVHGLQQQKKRGGTPNIFALQSLNIILDSILTDKFNPFPNSVFQLQKSFESNLKEQIPGLIIFAESSQRLPNTTLIGFEDGIPGDSLQIQADLAGFCISTGSACSSGSVNSSPVLKSMGYTESVAKSALRITSGYLNKESDFQKLVHFLQEKVLKWRAASSTLVNKYSNEADEGERCNSPQIGF